MQGSVSAARHGYPVGGRQAWAPPLLAGARNVPHPRPRKACWRRKGLMYTGVALSSTRPAWNMTSIALVIQTRMGWDAPRVPAPACCLPHTSWGWPRCLALADSARGVDGAAYLPAHKQLPRPRRPSGSVNARPCLPCRPACDTMAYNLGVCFVHGQRVWRCPCLTRACLRPADGQPAWPGTTS